MITLPLLTLSNTGYYQIDQSATLVTPWTANPHQWVRITASHTGFTANQSWSIRLWSSETPMGESISGNPLPNQRWVSPTKMARAFGYYPVTGSAPALGELLWLCPVAPDQQCWLNIRNMENKKNSFYLKIDLVDM